MIFLIIFIGLILRLISLNQSLWLDEATTALVAKMPLNEMFLKFLPGDFHPSLYYLIMKFWTGVFGYSEISLRMPSLIFGLGTTYLGYLIGRKIFDKKTGIIASALIATSGLSIYYSQEARMYSMAAFLVILSVYLFLNKKWIIFSIVLLLIGMTDYVSLFIIPVFLIADMKSWKKTLLSLTPLVFGFAVWSPIFIKQLLAGISTKGSNWWSILGLPTFQNLALIPVKFMFGRISFDNKILYFITVALVSLIFGILLYRSIKASKILWTWLIFPILIGFLVSFVIPSLIYFRYIFCLPAFYLLVAYGVEKTGKLTTVLIVILISFNLFTSGYYLFNSKFQREDWRGLVAFVESKKTNDSITIFPAGLNTEAYHYYAPNDKIAGGEAVGGNYKQIWFVDYLSSVFDPQGVTKSKIAALGYKKQAEVSFNGIGSIYLYKK